MKDRLRDSLKKKGWAEEDIEHTIGIIESGKIEDKSDSHERMQRIVYWVTLIITIIGNFLISVILIPFLLFISEVYLYLIIGSLALMFGFLYNFLIKDIDYLDKKHHIVAGIFIPILAIINVYFMSAASNKITSDILVETADHNPFMISTIYVGLFIAPFLLSKLASFMMKK